MSGSSAIVSLTALSSLVFLCTLDSPTVLTSSTTLSDMTSSEYSSHARSSGSSIALMRLAEHFRKAFDSALIGVAGFSSALGLPGLGACRDGESGCGQSKIGKFGHSRPREGDIYISFVIWYNTPEDAGRSMLSSRVGTIFSCINITVSSQYYLYTKCDDISNIVIQ